MGTIPTIHDPSKLFLEGQPRSNIERQSESAIQQAGTPALTAGNPGGKPNLPLL